MTAAERLTADLARALDSVDSAVAAAKAAISTRQSRALSGPSAVRLQPPHRCIDGLAEDDMRRADRIAHDWLRDVLGQHGDIDGTGAVKHLPSEDCIEVSAVVRVFVPLAGGGR